MSTEIISKIHAIVTKRLSMLGDDLPPPYSDLLYAEAIAVGEVISAFHGAQSVPVAPESDGATAKDRNWVVIEDLSPKVRLANLYIGDSAFLFDIKYAGFLKVIANAHNASLAANQARGHLPAPESDAVAGVSGKSYVDLYSESKQKLAALQASHDELLALCGEFLRDMDALTALQKPYLDKRARLAIKKAEAIKDLGK